MVGEVEVKGLTVRFNGVAALEDVSFTLSSPFFAAVMGPNGAGKTTLLKSMMGLVKPERGEVRLYGLSPFRDAGKLRQRVGYVPQVINVNAHVPMTVEEVVAMGALSITRPPRVMDKRVKRRVREALRLVELEEADKLFTELSGGQRQRALIARALVRETRLLLLDEPFSMLDFEIKCDVAHLLSRLHTELGIDILFVAHELSPCITYEPTIILLNKRVYAVGKAHKVLRPEILKKAYPGVTEVPSGFILGEDHA